MKAQPTGDEGKRSFEVTILTYNKQYNQTSQSGSKLRVLLNDVLGSYKGGIVTQEYCTTHYAHLITVGSTRII